MPPDPVTALSQAPTVDPEAMPTDSFAGVPGETRAMTEPTRRLDAPGLACIDLTPLIASNMRELQPDDILEVHTDDPAARVGVPAWCRLTRNPLVSSDELVHPSTNHTTFFIAKKDLDKKANQQ